MNNIIEIQNLTKFYGKSRGIIDVSFDVKEGEIFGFYRPERGRKIHHDPHAARPHLPHQRARVSSSEGLHPVRHELRRDIGYLPSEVFYYDDMKVIGLLKYSASFYGKIDMARIEYLAETMDLDLTRKIDDLSYGNKKKVGIVQGCCTAPSSSSSTSPPAAWTRSCSSASST
jgi:ABC-2 type transport system ATP-binding protein